MEKRVDEKEVKIYHPSWLNYTAHFFFFIVFIVGTIVLYKYQYSPFGLILLLVAFIILLKAVFGRISYTYTVTSKNVRSRVGIIAKNENEVKISDIREIGIRQSIGQRIFGIGDVYFASAGTGGVEVLFEGVKNPATIRDDVNEMRELVGKEEKKRCPQCGEFIWINATVCPHCNYKFEEK